MYAAILLIASLVVTAQAGTFIGCTSIVPPAPSYQSGITSQAACDARCAERAFDYSYYLGSTCACSRSGPRNSGIEATKQGGVGCSASYYTITKLSTTFGYRTCTSLPTLDSRDGSLSSAMTPIGSVEACFLRCAPKLTSILWPNSGGSGGWMCGCAEYPVTVTPVINGNCNSRSYYVFDHPPEAAASGLARRAARAAAAAAQMASHDLCPAGLTACRVSPGVDAYECLRTESELESCGGCRYGAVGNGTELGQQGVE